MSLSFAISTLIEAIIGGLLILGFMYEEKVIAFEQWLKKKVCKLIYNIIVAYEELSDRIVNIFRKRRNVKKVLFYYTYKFEEQYRTLGKLLGEDNEMVISSRDKHYACQMVIEMCGLEKAYKAYCKKATKK